MPKPAALLCSLLLLPLLATAPALGSGWPQWRGPANNGVAPDAHDLPARWSKTENLRWRLPLPGPAASTPVVWGDTLYLTSAVGDELALLAIGRDGRELWRRTVEEGGNYVARAGETNAASPSPVTDGETVWVTLGTGTVAAYSLAGEERWRADLEQRYGAFDYYFGMSSTPLLDGDTLYFLLLHTGAQLVVALDTETGAEGWRHPRATDARAECLHSYASPVIFRAGEEEMLLVQGADYLTAHDPATGAELWRHGGLNPQESYNPSLRFVATPAVAGELVVLPSAKNGPVVGLEPAGARGVITGSDPHTRWRLDSGTPDVPSPVVHDGLVYLSRETGVLTVVDAATGGLVYAERVHGAPHRGSPVVADGKVYLSGNDGTVSVVRAGRAFELLAKNELGERLQASPVVVGDTIYLRTYDALYAVGRSAPSPAGP
ncbi:MAG: PQQ-binding-like beta-propeller repeat protein [Thermoanaerobaculia bacterium]|nr:PQQ-binding-like beta-propeller repeat protein [Thermoanaerobaculia bacterium]